MDSGRKPRARSIPVVILGKGIVPAALLAALTSPMAYFTLERWEGNVLQVDADRQAGAAGSRTRDTCGLGRAILSGCPAFVGLCTAAGD